MMIAPPLEYNEIMSNVPERKIITIKEIRKYLAKKHGSTLVSHDSRNIPQHVAQKSCERTEDKILF